ncbi:MAG: metallophosphoesterase [Acidobacteria bacterium]|nr:MAG: metallophosphoesterase [Acidobacteriota bacterium]
MLREVRRIALFHPPVYNQPSVQFRQRVVSEMIGRRKQELRALVAAWIELARDANQAREIEIVHQPICLPGLPKAFDGYLLAQLSDIHYDVHHGSFADQEHIEAAVRAINRIQPDLVVLTGDYVTASVAYIQPLVEMLAEIEARDGIFAVLGNHDFWSGADRVARALRRRGIEVLRNTHTQLRRDGDAVALLGVDDATVLEHDLAAARRGVPRDMTTILLSHNPTLIAQAVRSGVDLMLSGHTHGGQIRLSPRSSRRRRSLWQGWRRFGPTQLYINRGLGTVVLPVRFQCPPEITVIELQCGSPRDRRWRFLRKRRARKRQTLE